MPAKPALIPCQRALFEIPEDIVYYNCAYLSPLMKRVREAGERALPRKAKPWEIVPRDFFDEADRLRALFARLIGSEAKDIALVPSVSFGIGVAARNVALKPGKRIVLLQEQFPSNVYPWVSLARSRGAKIIHVKRPADGNWTPGVLAVIDERTGVVALPQCHWTDGSLVDLIAVGERCREVGVPLVLDITQSLGVRPFDIAAVRPSFLVTSAYKWLLGPYGFALMYVAPEYHDGEPLEFNWLAREGSEDFAGLANYTDRLYRDARRFDMGERSNFITLPMVIAALQQILDWGIDRIEKTLAAYNQTLVRRAKGLGFQTIPERHRASHLLGLRFQGKLPGALAATLAEKRIYVSIRGDAIRISPHLYNHDADRDRFLHALEQAL